MSFPAPPEPRVWPLLPIPLRRSADHGGWPRAGGFSWPSLSHLMARLPPAASFPVVPGVPFAPRSCAPAVPCTGTPAALASAPEPAQSGKKRVRSFNLDATINYKPGFRRRYVRKVDKLAAVHAASTPGSREDSSCNSSSDSPQGSTCKRPQGASVERRASLGGCSVEHNISLHGAN
jgi:hypothetical protein